MVIFHIERIKHRLKQTQGGGFGFYLVVFHHPVEYQQILGLKEFVIPTLILSALWVVDSSASSIKNTVLVDQT